MAKLHNLAFTWFLTSHILSGSVGENFHLITTVKAYFSALDNSYLCDWIKKLEVRWNKCSPQDSRIHDEKRNVFRKRCLTCVFTTLIKQHAVVTCKLQKCWKNCMLEPGFKARKFSFRHPNFAIEGEKGTQIIASKNAQVVTFAYTNTVCTRPNQCFLGPRSWTKSFKDYEASVPTFYMVKLLSQE